MTPEELKYAKTHEWVAVEGGAATVGISAFAVEALTDLVFIELPEVGRTVAVDESFCEIESVKAVSDIYAPVAGEITAVNDSLPDALEKLNDDPYGEGWIVKIKLDGEADAGNLMDHAAYAKMCAEEAS
ncbi:MAG: glycine cleavage system protein GcvH [Planctomycetota bacterium]